MFSVGEIVKFSIRWQRFLCSVFREFHSDLPRKELVKCRKMIAIIVGRGRFPETWKIQWENGDLDDNEYHYTYLTKVL
jgi:hypothetical protein